MNKHLSAYIHIPFCVSKCRYCDIVSFAGEEELFTAYTQALLRQIKKNSQHTRPIDSIYIGGGTPSIMPAEYIAAVLGALRENYTLAPDCEISMEANPGTLTAEKLALYRLVGVNRLSIGVQSLNNDVLKNIGRIHSGEEALAAISMAKEAGFDNINADIMFSLPGQLLDDVVSTFAGVCAAGVEHISAYSLILNENTPLFADFEKGQYRQDEVLDRLMYHYITDKAPMCGFTQYEISNFAREGYECRHNLYCWQNEEYYGFGCAAHGFYDGVRYANSGNLREYITKAGSGGEYVFTETQTAEMLRRDYTMLALRTAAGINFADYRANFEKDFAAENDSGIAYYQSLGLLDADARGCRITKKGLDLADAVTYGLLYGV